MSSVGDLCGKGDILVKRRGVQARRKRYSRRCLVYGLVDRCAVALEVTVAAVDRLYRMASRCQGGGAQLCTVAGQRYRSQRRCAVVERDVSGRCVSCIIHMGSERDILSECGGVQT